MGSIVSTVSAAADQHTAYSFRYFVMSAQAQRSRVIQLYKNLLYLGREYPQGYDYFRTRCHNAFMKNKDIQGEQVEEWLAKGDYIIKELEALYMLKKYRTLKRRYYEEETKLS